MDANSGSAHMVERRDFGQLVEALIRAGYAVRGPTLRDGAIVYDTLHSSNDLPIGCHDQQSQARYRVNYRGHDAYFGYSLGPHSWKRYLYPPRIALWTATGGSERLQFHPAERNNPAYAFVGVRPCELRAIEIQDSVLMQGAHPDVHYRHRRERLFVLAVNCTTAAATCFCASMGSGPRASSGYDLLVTEMLDAHRHEFLIEEGSERGRSVMRQVPRRNASEDDMATAMSLVQKTATLMTRTVGTTGIREILRGAAESHHWEAVAERCFACANCTAVCPTCFCVTMEDFTDLGGTRAQRVRRWDSCFTRDFSHIHGGSIRSSTSSRYRQWLTHKFANWIDQFGLLGCVGCGRCIAWCPAGIDITEEIHALRQQAVLQGHAQEQLALARVPPGEKP